MQSVSQLYKTEMKKPFRNKGHIRAWIGVINKDAQKCVEFNDSRNNFIYFASVDGVINQEPVLRPYATCEQNYSAVDGSMYFLPRTNRSYFNQGIVTTSLLGTVYVSFGGSGGFDIKGLTIDFGVCYPTRLSIESNNGLHVYDNNSREFVTEDVFSNTSFFIIRAISMVGGQDRLRIEKFTCGIANVFSNTEVEDFFFKDYSSTLSDSIPSHDMTLTVDNRDLYYSPDNPDSALAYLEQGQDITVSFGYEVDDNGTIEWVEPTHTYLKTWSADDTQAKFNAVDIFDFKLGGTYYKGVCQRTTLYDLAIDVFSDAGIDSEDYYIDPYLKKVIVENPLPVTTHANCIQIIANAGRCALTLERGKRICLKSQFIPDCTFTVNNKTAYSNIDKLLEADAKDAYAEASLNYPMVDGTMIFMPRNSSQRKTTTGYISESMYVGNDTSGYSWTGAMPKITITFESEWIFYGFIINFRSIAPKEFVVTYYKSNAVVGIVTITNPDVNFVSYDQSPETDKLEITITKGSPNARVFIDNILINDVTDYTLTRSLDISESPNATREKRVRSISVIRHTYQDVTKMSLIESGNLYVGEGNTDVSVDFSNAIHYIDTFLSVPPFIDYGQASPTPYQWKVRFTASPGPPRSSLYWGSERLSGLNEKVVTVELAREYSGAYDIIIRVDSSASQVDARLISVTDRTVVFSLKGYVSEQQTVEYTILGREMLAVSYSIYGIETKALANGEIELPSGQTVIRVNIQNPSYLYTVIVTDGDATAEIIDSSSYFVDIRFTVQSAQLVRYAVHGFEYIINDYNYEKIHRNFGDDIKWDNPLVSTESHARDMEEWLESYYLGDVDYDVNWRGDPRVDANDLFYMELKDRDETLIRAYKSELTFNGAWNGNLRARKAVVSWR